LRDHPLYPRIKDLFEDEMRKIKAKRINFELFLYLLSVFHVKTNVETKVKYIFRLYDCDKNLKIDANDLLKVYKLIYQFPYFQEEDYSKLVTETLIRFATKGEIKLENLMEILPHDEVM
jgi:Ca2+-binding EF-hand superfamily protein